MYIKRSTFYISEKSEYLINWFIIPDQGIQHTCKDYIKILKDKGNPYDNAFAESFIKTLKQEKVYLWQYETYLDVAERIPYFILDVYNKKRLHSALGYRPPE